MAVRGRAWRKQSDTEPRFQHLQQPQARLDFPQAVRAQITPLRNVLELKQVHPHRSTLVKGHELGN